MTIPFLLLLLFAQPSYIQSQNRIRTASELTGDYLPFLLGKQVGVVANQTSMIGNTHLVDSLLRMGVSISRVFCPEHGFRGKAEAGELVHHGTDSLTGLPVISLYGEHRKPRKEDLQGLDVMVFEIQDIGVRFYTYISTLHYVMEACALEGLPLIVLDRPNPNGFYVDGPLLDTAFRSFVGMHPIPVVHGLTVGELARMINGEYWLADSLQCELRIIPCGDYTHDSLYRLTVAPSPNLPNMESVYLYPGICLFEGTVMSLGRGTPWPFQLIGHPQFPDTNFSFTPRSLPGISRNPPFRDQRCFGRFLVPDEVQKTLQTHRLPLGILLETYQAMKPGLDQSFFSSFFTKLAGTEALRKQIEEGLTESEIRHSWRKELREYRKMRKKYLLYPDFRITWMELLFG